MMMKWTWKEMILMSMCRALRLFYSVVVPLFLVLMQVFWLCSEATLRARKPETLCAK